MGDMGPRGAINMGGRDMKQKTFVTCNSLGDIHAICGVCIFLRNMEPVLVKVKSLTFTNL
jgi:hypothetical protein